MLGFLVQLPWGPGGVTNLGRLDRIGRRMGDQVAPFLHLSDVVEQPFALVDLDFCRGHQQSHLRSEEHTSELQSLMRISYAVFCLKKKTYRQSKMSIKLVLY